MMAMIWMSMLVACGWRRVGGKTYAVPQPVGGGGETDTTGADWEREDLADDNPGAGTPGGREEEDVDADESDHGLDGVRVVAVRHADDGDDEFGNEHADSAPDQDRATAEFLDGPEGEGRGEHVDDGGDHADHEGIVDGAQVGQESCSKVEDEVDAGPLLHHLQGGAQDGTAEVAGGLGEAATEAVEPRVPVAGLRNDLQFILVVGDDFGEFLLDFFRVCRLATEPREGLSGFLDVVLLDEVTRRFGESEKTSSKDDGPKHLQRNGNAVGARVLAILGAIIYTSGYHETDGDAELEEC